MLLLSRYLGISLRLSFKLLHEVDTIRKGCVNQDKRQTVAFSFDNLPFNKEKIK